MKKIIVLMLALVLAAGVLTGCAEKGELTVLHGESQEIQLSKDYEALTWTSSDPEVAVVDQGVVTGAAPGNAVITAESNGKVVAEYQVGVEIVEITSIFLQSTEEKLKIDETVTLSYSLFPADASEYGLTYTSINPAIATVAPDGTVTAVAPGKTTIVLSNKAGLTASCEVTVLEPTAIEQLNEEEQKLLDYMTGTALRSFYNASAVRFRDLYVYKATKEGYVYSASSVMIADFQGTNKLGGTIHRYYMLGAPSDTNGGFILPCKEDYVPDMTLVMKMPTDIVDYIKMNAALDEYWGITSVSK